MSISTGRLRPPLGTHEQWTVTDATELYEVARWGKGYFSITARAMSWSTPPRTPREPSTSRNWSIDLQLRGINLPILLRFTDILRHRVGEIHDAFQTAITEYDYKGHYCCVYPIKVNQQRHVVEEILDFGKPYHFGLEAGSKPELLAVLALTDNDTPIICNGFKDDEFIKMAMLARKIGKQDHPGRREVHRAGADRQVRRGARRPAARSACASSWRPAAPAAGSRRPASAPSSA